MKKNAVPITRTEDKLLSNEDYDNYHRTKPITFGKLKYGSQSIQTTDSCKGIKITTIHFNIVIP